MRQARIVTFKHKLAIMGENQQDETLKMQKFKHHTSRAHACWQGTARRLTLIFPSKRVAFLA